MRAPSPPLRKHKKSVHTPGSAVYTPGSVSGLSRDSAPGSSAKRRLITSPHQQAKFKIPNKHMKPSSAVPRGGGAQEKDGRRVCGRSAERSSGSREAGRHSSKGRSHQSGSYKRRVLPISGLLLPIFDAGPTIHIVLEFIFLKKGSQYLPALMYHMTDCIAYCNSLQRIAILTFRDGIIPVPKL